MRIHHHTDNRDDNDNNDKCDQKIIVDGDGIHNVINAGKPV